MSSKYVWQMANALSISFYTIPNLIDCEADVTIPKCFLEAAKFLDSFMNKCLVSQNFTTFYV